MGDTYMATPDTYLKRHTEALVKDVGIAAACELTGKSKATLGRYYSDKTEHADRFMPIDTVAALEAAASYPHVTSALADLRGITMSLGDPDAASEGGVNAEVVALSRQVPFGDPLDPECEKAIHYAARFAMRDKMPRILPRVALFSNAFASASSLIRSKPLAA